MKKRISLLMFAALLVIPVTGFASGDHAGHGMKMDMDMDHGKEMAKDHGKKMDHDMGTMDHDGKMNMLGSEIVDGVKALIHLNDVREQMAKHGMKQTHHIMIAFEDVKTGKAIESGSAAVKIEDPDENISKAVKLMAMAGHFGVDITLDKKGMYHFKIGTKLADGKNRMFHSHYDN